MKHYLAIIVLFLFLTSCSSEPATPNPAEVSLTMLADQVNAQATQAKFESIQEVTQQVVNATSTQQAVFVQATGTQQARIDAEATSQQEHAWAQATSDQARRDVQATQARIDADATQAQARRDAEATQQQARLDAQATQFAIGTSTAFSITQTAIPPANTMTAIAQNQEIQLKDSQVQLSNLEVEQQRQKNTPQWVIPYVAGISAVMGLLFYVYKQSKVRVEKNEDGGVDILILDGPHGPIAIRPKLLPAPVFEIRKDGEFNTPLLVAPAEQAKVTERAQAVDAISKMPNHTTPQAAQTFNKYFGPQQQDLPFDVIDAEDAPPAGLIDGESFQAMNKDWKEAKDAQQ